MGFRIGVEIPTALLAVLPIVVVVVVAAGVGMVVVAGDTPTWISVLAAAVGMVDTVGGLGAVTDTALLAIAVILDASIALADCLWAKMYLFSRRTAQQCDRTSRKKYITCRVATSSK